MNADRARTDVSDNAIVKNHSNMGQPLLLQDEAYVDKIVGL